MDQLEKTCHLSELQKFSLAPRRVSMLCYTVDSWKDVELRVGTKRLQHGSHLRDFAFSSSAEPLAFVWQCIRYEDWKYLKMLKVLFKTSKPVLSASLLLSVELPVCISWQKQTTWAFLGINESATSLLTGSREVSNWEGDRQTSIWALRPVHNVSRTSRPKWIAAFTLRGQSNVHEQVIDRERSFYTRTPSLPVCQEVSTAKTDCIKLISAVCLK